MIMMIIMILIIVIMWLFLSTNLHQMCYQRIASNHNTSLLTHCTDIVDGDIKNKESIKSLHVLATAFDR